MQNNSWLYQENPSKATTLTHPPSHCTSHTYKLDTTMHVHA